MDPSSLNEYERWLWLVLSLIGAVVLDFAVVRLALEFGRPTSTWAFWAGRAGKLTAVLAWVIFFNSFWYPRYLVPPADEGFAVSIPDWIKWTETGVLLGMLVLAFVTLPRSVRPMPAIDLGRRTDG